MAATLSIPEFYAGQDVFITGATGFMGKVLVEKLLRSCPDVKTIFLLMRAKKGMTPEQRIAQITQLPTSTNPLTDTMPSQSSCDPADDNCPIKELETCGFKYGATATKNQFPHVAFLESRNAHRVQYCSGSLIQPRWVLTSAYCTLPYTIVEVTLGALVPFNKEDPDRVVVHSQYVFVHPGYVPFYKEPKNDLALIKLPKLTRSAATIPVVMKRFSGPLTQEDITFAGWGEVGYETLTFTKNLAIFEGPCKCKNTEKTINRKGNVAGDATFFCCFSEDFFCFIHNGGGLLINGVLVAVLSTRCFPHCRHSKGIFTNIYNHLQWIDDTLHGDIAPEVYETCNDPSIFIPGVYFIQPSWDVHPFKVHCDIRLDGKWTVIQQRFNKSVDFYRNYADYTKGFGPLTGNHWLGLEKIHQLTKKGDHELMVEMQGYNLTKAYAKYSTFKVDSEETGFQLTISGYSGTAGDSMYNTGLSNENLNGMKFSTFDKDQDMSPVNCALEHRGPWWHNNCAYSNLNGYYYDTPVEGWKTMRWYKNFGLYALKSVRMLVRRK